MSTGFNPHKGIIRITAYVRAAAGDSYLAAIVDTGTEGVVIDEPVARALRLTAVQGAPRVAIIPSAGSGGFGMPVTIPELTALGKTVTGASALSTPLRPELNADLLLGLDFFRGSEIHIDLRTGRTYLT